MKLRKKHKRYRPPKRTYDPRKAGALCKQCPLRDQKNAVPTGPVRKAKLVILGEAPGPIEESRNEYFAGPSGEELRAACADAGIPWSAVSLNNCLQCKPRTNISVKDWKKALECCWPRLEEELCQSGTPMILGLGKWSQYVLRGKTDPIHDWCGSPYPVATPFASGGAPSEPKKPTKEASKKGGKQRSSKRSQKKAAIEPAPQRLKAQCITSYHPAYALRGKRQYLFVMQSHLESAWGLSTGSLKPWKWPTIYAKDDKAAVAALKRLLRDVKKGKIKRIGIDIETSGSNPVMDTMTKVGLSSRSAAISLSWPLRKDAATLVRAILAHPVAKAAHNGTHDLIGFERVGWEVNGYEFDTIIQHATWAPTLLHRLQFACCTEFHMPAWKKEFKVGGQEKGLERFLKADPLELGIYNAKDAYMTLLLSYALERRLKNEVPGWEDLYGGYLRRSLISKEMRKHGVWIHRENLRRHLKSYLRRRRRAGLDMRKLATRIGYDPKKNPKWKKKAKEARAKGKPEPPVPLVNPGSGGCMKDLFFRHMRAKSTKYSPKTGAPSLNEKVLQHLSTYPDPRISRAAHILMRFRRWQKLVGYTRKLYLSGQTKLNPDGQCWGTKTGRWAYKGDRPGDPNMTTIPTAKYKKSKRKYRNEKTGAMEQKDILVAPNLREMIRASVNCTMVARDFCVDPQTKVLCADLRWRKAGELVVGDVLVGFPETFRRAAHNFEPSIVEATKSLTRGCYRITTDQGEITVSAEHRLARSRRAHDKQNRPRHWVEAQDLVVGDRLAFFAKPWKEDRSFEAGWMSGFLDGEGYIDSGLSIGLGQNEGPALQRYMKNLHDNGFTWVEDRKRKCVKVRVCKTAEALRILGTFRPERLLAKAEQAGGPWIGRRTWGRKTARATIQKIEYVGKRQVVALQTSTKTFVANGILSHNSQLELRIMAYLSGDDLLIEWYESGRDIHTENAKRWFGMDDPPKYIRKLAKGIVFGMNYGGGAKTLWENLVVEYPGLGLNDVQKYIDLWYQHHPKIRVWQNKLMDIAEETDRVHIPLSGKIVTLHGDRDPPKIYNPPVQGGAAAIIDAAIERVWPQLKRDQGETLLLQVHDELVGESRAPKRLSRLLKVEMERPVELNGRTVIFPTEAKCGPTWGEMKDDGV